jgi:hypothetical protein
MMNRGAGTDGWQQSKGAVFMAAALAEETDEYESTSIMNETAVFPGGIRPPPPQ